MGSTSGVNQDDLWDAVAKGKINTLKQRWTKDESLLYNCKLGCFDQSILHVVASHGNVEDVKDILKRDPELAEVVDSRQWSPLHVAAVKGHMAVLEVLLPYSLHVARVKTNHGETILHLCIKHNRLHTLQRLIEYINDSEFPIRKDVEGNTILHLAVMLGHIEIVKYLVMGEIVDLSSRNSHENTPLDIAYKNKQVTGMYYIENLLRKSGAVRSKHLNGGQWLTEKRGSLMVVASLIATMAFQAGVSPPGGVWQDNSKLHRAGEAVMSYNYPDSYPFFLRFNTVGFVGSLSTILLLITGLPFRKKFMMWFLVLMMWVTISAMAVTYAFAITVVTPIRSRGPLTNTIVIGVIVWVGVMFLLLLWHSLVLLNKWFHYMNIHPCPNIFSEFFRICKGPSPESEHPPAAQQPQPAAIIVV